MHSSSLSLVLGAALAAALAPQSLNAQESAMDGERDDAGASSPAEGGGIAGYERAEDISGRQIFNAIGEEIGEISGIIISGDRVTHAVISIGGFVGLGGSDVVVPFGVLRFGPERVTIDTLASSDQIEELTLFEPRDFGLSD